jgi:hypothetical protein
MSKKPIAVTKPKSQSPAKKNTKSPATITTTVIPSELPPAGDLSFSLDPATANHPESPVLVSESPTATNASQIFKQFQETGSVEIDASALMPGIACPFTSGCAERGGKVRIMSDTTMPKQLEDGRTAVQRVQQFHCRTCGQVAKGVKPVGGVAVGGPRLFNRMTAKAE